MVTIIVAGAVAIIGYRQWKTAREKLILDLFERRYAVFDRAMSAVTEAMRDGDVRKNESIRTIAMLRGEADFLFGDEVTTYLKQLQATLAELGLSRSQYDAGNTEHDWPQRTLDASLAILAAYEGGLAKLFAPYMRMTHKL